MPNKPKDAIRITPQIDLTSLRKFVRERLIPRSAECDRTEEFPHELYQELHEMGWLKAFIPEKYGGTGLGTVDLACVARELAYGSGGAFSTFTVNVLGMLPVLHYASESLREKLCKDFQEKYSLWSYAMTEPDTGSEISNTRTVARRVKGGYILNGRKCFITNGSYSKHLSVFARIVEDGKPSHLHAIDDKPKITVFYVPGDSPGLHRGLPLKKLGQRDSNTAELFFTDLFVPDEHRIGEEGQGLRIAFHCLQKSKTLIAAASVGFCDRIHEITSQYLGQRELYGKPLLEQPVIHHLLAQLCTEAQAAWLLTCWAAETWDSGELAVKEASMAKLFGPHTAVKFASEALELFGGYGYSREYEIEKLNRDVRILEIYEGPTFVQQQLIARELFPTLRHGGQQRARATLKKAA
jgi:acyl-CoA dehydrogenase